MSAFNWRDNFGLLFSESKANVNRILVALPGRQSIRILMEKRCLFRAQNAHTRRVCAFWARKRQRFSIKILILCRPGNATKILFTFAFDSLNSNPKLSRQLKADIYSKGPTTFFSLPQ